MLSEEASHPGDRTLGRAGATGSEAGEKSPGDRTLQSGERRQPEGGFLSHLLLSPRIGYPSQE